MPADWLVTCPVTLSLCYANMTMCDGEKYSVVCTKHLYEVNIFQPLLSHLGITSNEFEQDESTLCTLTCLQHILRKTMK